ncbi:MAG: hypothetical protein DMF98_10915 [Acidobacteria bacterium]|nr:MAG: hypothetical protein DMF98_10915 [Acidobacteriota bacterium]
MPSLAELEKREDRARWTAGLWFVVWARFWADRLTVPMRGATQSTHAEILSQTRGIGPEFHIMTPDDAAPFTAAPPSPAARRSTAHRR